MTHLVDKWRIWIDEQLLYADLNKEHLVYKPKALLLGHRRIKLD